MLGYPFEKGSLAEAADVASLFDKYPMYESAFRWVREFVMKPNKAIDRPGAVCPRVAPAIRQGLLWFVAIQVEESSPVEAFEKGQYLPTLYESLFPDQQSFRTGSVLAFFPHLDPNRAGEFIDVGHQMLRMDFVSRGLMIGEFHSDSSVTSIRNADLPVMQCPVPMFAVRALTHHDLMFLDRDKYSAANRVMYLNYYLKYVGDQIDSDARTRVEERIHIIEQLEESGEIL